MALEWDEDKRQSNLDKHGLDFADADFVLASNVRWDIMTTRNGELRTQSIAKIADIFLTLSLIHMERNLNTRIISFRPASAIERAAYEKWIDS